MKISAIIYDLVGPLLIRKADIVFDPQIQEINRRCGSTTDETSFWKEIASEYSYSDQKIEEIKNLIAGAYMKNVPMWDFHQKIKSKYKTAILNNGTLSIFKRWKEQFHLSEEFAYVLNSAEIGLKKPDPKIFSYCMDKLGVTPEQCIFIDDDKRNTDAATSLGIHAILYLPQRHDEFLKEFNEITKI